MKFECTGNDCEEHFLKDFWFCEDITFLDSWKYTKETHGDCELQVRKSRLIQLEMSIVLV